MKKAVEYSLSAKKCDFESVKISHSKDASDYARKFYFDDILIYESVFMIFLNRATKVIGYAKISQGGVASSTVDTSIVCKYAIDTLCHGVILVHNHPSGLLTPSKSDISMTTKIKNALSLFDVTLMDHVIITEDGYISLADEGIIL